MSDIGMINHGHVKSYVELKPGETATSHAYSMDHGKIVLPPPQWVTLTGKLKDGTKVTAMVFITPGAGIAGVRGLYFDNLTSKG